MTQAPTTLPAQEVHGTDIAVHDKATGEAPQQDTPRSVRVKGVLRRGVALAASSIEIFISIIVLLAIVIVGVRVIVEAIGLARVGDVYESFNTFLGHAFNLVIGVEFIKMLAKHTPGSAIEVLLFAIARQMVVSHTTPMENLIGIITIALIFVIRKFLFVHSFGEHLPNHPAKPAEEMFDEEKTNKMQGGLTQ